MIDPKRIALQVALRMLHLIGTDQAELEASYVDADWTSVLDGSDVPASALSDAVVASEAKIAQAIALDKLHPYRADLLGRSDDLASGDETPSVTDEGVAFIGVLSEINDSANNLPLTEMPVQVIRRFLRGSYVTEIYYYAWTGSRIIHTRDNVYLEGCGWDRTQASARLDPTSTDLSPLNDACEQLWIFDTLGSMAQEGYFMSEAQHYNGLAMGGFAMLASRKAPIVLDATSTPEPIKG